MILTETDLYNFLKKVCSEIPATGQSCDENHFYGSFEEAAAAKRNNKLLWPAIIMGSNAGKIISNTMDIKTASIYVLKYARKEDWEAQREARDECLEIGFAIMERINMYRHANDGRGQELNWFKTDEIRYQEVTSTIDGAIGYHFLFFPGSQRSLRTDFPTT